MVRTGLSVLQDNMTPLTDGTVGLITNPSGVAADLTTTIDILHDHPDVDLVRLFGPEHGIRGKAQAGEHVEDSTDDRTGLPVTSLYGETRRVDPEMVADIDTVVYDMQDVGCRFYTYLYTLAYALEGVGQTDTDFVVLDRPNPVAPLGVDGKRVPPDEGSFVGDYRLPITHGLTVGELARYFNGEFDMGATLSVVELDGWDRSMWYDDLDLPWVPPSPNIPTLDTATLYPGTCLFEGTTLSEGRGTTKPFELVGALWIDGGEWAKALNGLDLSGVRFRPTHFTPTFSKHEGEDVEGVQIHVTDRDALSPVAVGLKLLLSTFSRHPETEWRLVDGMHFVDRLAAGEWLRETVADVDSETDVDRLYEDIRKKWDSDLTEFASLRDTYGIYQ
jgi:beta-N-acetylhexosaminidase